MQMVLLSGISLCASTASCGMARRRNLASTVEATSAALAGLLREGLVELWGTGDRDVDPERLPLRDAEAVAVDPASWVPPCCWGYSPALTAAGDEVWAAICDDKRRRGLLTTKQ